MRKINTKKQDMTMLYEFIMLVAVISIIALLVFQVNDDAREDIIEEDRATVSVVNETLTTVTETGENFAYATKRDVTCTVTAVINATDGVAIPAANRTTTNCNIKYSGPTGIFNNTDWKVSYTADYSADTNRYNATIANDTAVAKIPKSLKLLATAIIFGAVLYVILRVIPIRSTGSVIQ